MSILPDHEVEGEILRVFKTRLDAVLNSA
uniref:Uncharacterized protein n=1 Tax=Anguilla anguilla TaxID=7936 RepID=A0A0E9TXM2_ANGAN